MDAGRNILKDEQRRFARLKSAQHAAALNLVVYGGLTVAELWIAQLAHSRALAADGLNNLTGVASALILLWGLQVSQQRPDSEHRFGHFYNPDCFPQPGDDYLQESSRGIRSGRIYAESQRDRCRPAG